VVDVIVQDRAIVLFTPAEETKGKKRKRGLLSPLSFGYG